MAPSADRRVGLKHLVFRLLFTGSLRPKACSHRHLIRVVEPAARVCADCVALGDRWPALRMCLICGYVGCCNDAKNKHALKHYQATGQPLMRSIERGDDWLWCYVDKAYRFCEAPDCPTVYYRADGQQAFGEADLRERVYQKHRGADDELNCYCFQHLVGEIRAEIARTGTSTVVDRITAGIQRGQCACDLRNPQGNCCLGQVLSLVRDLTGGASQADDRTGSGDTSL